MIVNTFTEEQILNELISDFIKLKKYVSRKVKKEIESKKKTGIPITEDDDFIMNITSSLNNHWFANISYTPKEKAFWRCDMCCIVESEKKTKDYYIVRGKKDNYYFIKITSHAIKRFIERGGYFKDFSHEMSLAPEMVATHLICPHETIVGMKYTEIQYYDYVSKLDIKEEIDEEASYMFELMRGVYFGHKTNLGNYIFKTFISNEMSLENIFRTREINSEDYESFLSYMLIFPHQYYNKHLWEEENLNNYLYREFGKDADINFENSKFLLLKP